MEAGSLTTVFTDGPQTHRIAMKTHPCLKFVFLTTLATNEMRLLSAIGDDGTCRGATNFFPDSRCQYCMNLC